MLPAGAPIIPPGYLRETELYYERTTLVNELNMLPIRENEDAVTGLINRIAALTQLAAYRFQQVQNAFPNNRPVLVLTMENRDNINAVDHPFGPGRRFRSRQDILNHLPEALDVALYNLSQSDDTWDLEELTFQIRIYRGTPANAQGRIKAYIKKTIHNDSHTQGLYTYGNDDQLCGFKAVVYHLTVHHADMGESFSQYFQWVLDFWERQGVPWTTQNLQSRQRFYKLAKQLAEHMNYLEPYNWIVSPIDMSSSARLCLDYPKFQVILFNEPTRQVLEHRRGVEFNPNDHPEAWTILLSYTAGHVKLIKGIFAYLGKVYRAGNRFCYACATIQTRDQHDCSATTQCKACYMKFSSEEDLTAHRKGLREMCPQCNRTFMNQACLDYHFCRAAHTDTCQECRKKIFPNIPHHCGSYHCLTCRERVGEAHQCQMVRPEFPDPDVQPEKECEHYYAFDLESMLIRETDSRRHVVNLVVVRRVFTGEEWIFGSLQEFVNWLETLTETSYMFAHNMKGYDGRMVFEYLIDRCTPPQAMTWNGAKIMQMQYGKIYFRDTLLHLPASLAQLPKMMGLNEDEYKKGFFPYLFNTPDNQNYIGPLPAQHYFDPDMMGEKKRKEFLKWHSEYAEEIGDGYDFHKELVEYCQSDVKILSETIKAYVTQQMKRYPLNPLSQITIASYAMSLYKLYHMPDDCFYRLSILEDQRIRESMHGGRTDTRRMLKEWSDDEIRRGYYGKYQDVQSLYPTVQFYDPLPIGRPEYLTWGPNHHITVEEIKGIFGFVCCDIVCEKPLFHPILVHNAENGKLLADLNPKYKIVVPTPELHLALDHGYRVTRLYWAYKFHHTTELFKTYFQDFLKDKLEASGVPKWVRTEEDWKEFKDYHDDELGIELLRENMIPNASRKTGAKLLCNSLWGKFGERMHLNSWKICQVGKDDGEIMALEKRWMDGKVDLTYRRYNQSNTHLAMAYKITNPTIDNILKGHLGKVNIALASMVTSHARCRLWKELNKLGKRVLYHDTDSIIYEHQPDAYNIPEGRYLGEWEDETGGNPIVKFVSTGPKCYTYVVREADGSLKETSKVKGITLNAFNQTKVNYDSMKDLVTGDISQIETKCLMFKYDRIEGTMVTKTIIKLLKQVYEKGEIDETDWVVYPFGYRQFEHTTTMTT